MSRSASIYEAIPSPHTMADPLTRGHQPTFNPPGRSVGRPDDGHTSLRCGATESQYLGPRPVQSDGDRPGQRDAPSVRPSSHEADPRVSHGSRGDAGIRPTHASATS